MNKLKPRIKFQLNDPEQSQKSLSNLNPIGSQPKLFRKKIQFRRPSRSSKASPEPQNAVIRKSSELVLPFSNIYFEKAVFEKQDPKKKNFTPMISPKIEPKMTHRRISSESISNIYKYRVINEIKNLENSKKRQIKNCKSSTILKLNQKIDTEKISELNPFTETNQSEKELLIKYINQYFLLYNECPPASINFYKIVGLIGKGAFGKVLECEHKLTGKSVAIKAIPKLQLKSQKSQKKVFQEVCILRKIKSKHVIKVLEVFESEKNFLIVLEHAGGGDLLHYVREKGRLKEEEAKKIFKQVVLGAISIHEAGVLHRDFKLDNILMDSKFSCIKICDFGVSKVVKQGEKILDQCGTPAYLAPEIIKNEGYEGYYVDIWSLGIVLYTMICGTIPFKASNVSDLHKAILTGIFEIPSEISDHAQDLIRKMIVIEPKSRTSLYEVLKHPWFVVKNTKEIDRSLPQFLPKNIKEYSPEINDYAILTLVELGFPYEFVVNSLKNNEINHATATYYLIS